MCQRQGPLRRDMSGRGINASSERGRRSQSHKATRTPDFAVVGHVGPVVTGDVMSASHALAALAALGQPTRLKIFRLLMRREPSGMSAGAIAEAVGCPHNTVSSHLSILARADLIHGSREGRAIIYRANVEGMQALIAFLIIDCCDARPELCNLMRLANKSCCEPAATIAMTDGKNRP